MDKRDQTTLSRMATAMGVGLLLIIVAPLLGPRQTNDAMVMLGLTPLIGLAVYTVWKM